MQPLATDGAGRVVRRDCTSALPRPLSIRRPPGSTFADTSHPADQWVVQLYDDLRILARSHLRRERTGHTLSTTGLVNEAWLRLSQQHSLGQLGRADFFTAASATMRRVLVDSARTRMRAKRGGGSDAFSLDDVASVLSIEEAEELVALDAALERLQGMNPRGAQVVQCRFLRWASRPRRCSASG